MAETMTITANPTMRAAVLAASGIGEPTIGEQVRVVRERTYINNVTGEVSTEDRRTWTGTLRNLTGPYTLPSGNTSYALTVDDSVFHAGTYTLGGGSMDGVQVLEVTRAYQGDTRIV